MTIAVELQPISGTPPAVHYQWDRDTDIFTATLSSPSREPAPSGAVEIEGSDGTWLVLELRGGHLVGVEVALWPDVHRNPTLAPPCDAQSAAVVVPMRASQGAATVEIEAPVRAEADDAEQLVHFRIGERRHVRSVRVGSDLLLDLDREGCLAGLWFLNVPPFPLTP
ncbi:MAG TPA: hypothetical protein VFP15_07620 [Gemmatimonadaceae bacterium]|nr:hypothetical protein [Gemmatimonadaceae bacterium]